LEILSIALLLFNQIFTLVIFIFLVIAVLLIYSLLMIGVETKTLETGIMRMVGVSKRGNVASVLVNSLLFVIPAVISGFILCVPVLALGFKFIFKEQLTGAFKPFPSTSSVLLSLTLGLLIPLLSSILPILRLLSQSLTDSLSFQRSRVKSTYVEILRKSRAHILPYVIFGLITTLYGLGIYYMLPLSLLSFNLGLIMWVFVTILVGFLFGLILLAVNAQRLIETLILHVFLFWEHPAQKRLLKNNMKAHQ